MERRDKEENGWYIKETNGANYKNEKDSEEKYLQIKMLGWWKE